MTEGFPTILYSAVILNQPSIDLIKKKFPPKHKDIHLHHMTILYRKNQRVPAKLGDEVSLKVIGYSEDAKIQVIVVDPPDDIHVDESKTSHITVSTAEGVSPRYANDLLDDGFDNVTPFKVSGVLSVVGIDGQVIDSTMDYQEVPKAPEEILDDSQIAEGGFIIYCDLDGVLTDFEGAFSRYFNTEFKDSQEYLNNTGKYQSMIGTSDFKQLESMLKGSLKEVLSVAPLEFWSEMDWTQEGRSLWNSIKPLDPIILTEPFETSECYIGKRQWVKKNLGNIPTILSKEKYLYINNDLKVSKDRKERTKILIDDHRKNTDRWESSGGISILHRSVSNTLKQLKQLGAL